jgi:minimal PKS acyl carrier protein
MSDFTLAELRTIMRQAAGEIDVAGSADDVADVRYADLGYDSLALLEITAKIKQSLGVEVPDEYVAGCATPAATVAAVNEILVGARCARGSERIIWLSAGSLRVSTSEARRRHERADRQQRADRGAAGHGVDGHQQRGRLALAVQ